MCLRRICPSFPDSLCSSFVTQRYQLPVMDSIFVRKRHRGNGFGLQMLENFVDSFNEDSLGLRYPLPTAMCKGNPKQQNPFILIFQYRKCLLKHCTNDWMQFYHFDKIAFGRI